MGLENALYPQDTFLSFIKSLFTFSILTELGGGSEETAAYLQRFSRRETVTELPRFMLLAETKKVPWLYNAHYYDFSY